MPTFTDLYLMEMARMPHKMGDEDQQYMDSTKADLAEKAKKCRSTNTPFVVTLKPGFPTKQAKARIKDIVREAAIKIREHGLPQHYVLKNEGNNTAILIDGDRDNYRTVSAPIAHEFITKGAQCPGAIKYTGNPSDVQLLKQVTGKGGDNENAPSMPTTPPSPVIPTPSAPVTPAPTVKRRGRPPKKTLAPIVNTAVKQDLLNNIVQNYSMVYDDAEHTEIKFILTKQNEQDIRDVEDTITSRDIQDFYNNIYEKFRKTGASVLSIVKESIGKKFSLFIPNKNYKKNETLVSLQFLQSVFPIQHSAGDKVEILWKEHNQKALAKISSSKAADVVITDNVNATFSQMFDVTNDYSTSTNPGIVDTGITPSQHNQDVTEKNDRLLKAIFLERRILRRSRSVREMIIDVSNDVIRNNTVFSVPAVHKFSKQLVDAAYKEKYSYISVIKYVNGTVEKVSFEANTLHSVVDEYNIANFYNAVLPKTEISHSNTIAIDWDEYNFDALNKLNYVRIGKHDNPIDAFKNKEKKTENLQVYTVPVDTPLKSNQSNSSNSVGSFAFEAKTPAEYSQQLQDIYKSYRYNADSREIIFNIPPKPALKAYVHVKELYTVHNEIVKAAKENNVHFVSFTTDKWDKKDIIDLRKGNTFGDAKWRGVYTFVSRYLIAGTKVTGRTPETYMEIEKPSSTLISGLKKHNIDIVEDYPKNTDPRKAFAPDSSVSAFQDTMNQTGRNVTITTSDTILDRTPKEVEIKDEFVNNIIGSITHNQGISGNETSFVVAAPSNKKVRVKLKPLEYLNLVEKITNSIQLAGDKFVSAIIDPGKRYIMSLDPRYNKNELLNTNNNDYIYNQIKSFVTGVIPYSVGVETGFYFIKFGSVNDKSLKDVYALIRNAHMTQNAESAFKSKALSQSFDTKMDGSAGSSDDVLKKAALDVLSAMTTKPTDTSVFNAPSASDLPTSNVTSSLPPIPADVQLSIGKDKVNKYIEMGKNNGNKFDASNMWLLTTYLADIKKLPGGSIRDCIKSIGSLFGGMDGDFLSLVNYYMDCYKATNDEKYISAIAELAKGSGFTREQYDRLHKGIRQLQEIENFLRILNSSFNPYII